MDIYQIFAILAGAMVVVSTIPQVIKILKTKEVKDLSLAMFLLLIGAQVIWFFYGFHIKDIPVILTNGLSMIVVAINIILILKYRTAPQK